MFVLWPLKRDMADEQGTACLVAAECTAAIMAVGNYDATDQRADTKEEFHVRLRVHCGLACGLINFFCVGQGQF